MSVQANWSFEALNQRDLARQFASALKQSDDLSYLQFSYRAPRYLGRAIIWLPPNQPLLQDFELQLWSDKLTRSGWDVIVPLLPEAPAFAAIAITPAPIAGEDIAAASASTDTTNDSADAAPSANNEPQLDETTRQYGEQLDNWIGQLPSAAGEGNSLYIAVGEINWWLSAWLTNNQGDNNAYIAIDANVQDATLDNLLAERLSKLTLPQAQLNRLPLTPAAQRSYQTRADYRARLTMPKTLVLDYHADVESEQVLARLYGWLSRQGWNIKQHAPVAAKEP